MFFKIISTFRHYDTSVKTSLVLGQSWSLTLARLHGQIFMARWDFTILISNDRTINNITLNDPDILKNLLMAGYTEISSPVTGSWKDEITPQINNKVSFNQPTFFLILVILFFDSNTFIQNPVGKELKGNPLYSNRLFFTSSNLFHLSVAVSITSLYILLIMLQEEQVLPSS